MVANTSTAAERFVPFEGGRLLPRFTRRDAEALVRMGIIPEDASTELLNGLIVLKDRATTGENPFMVGQDHRKAVERLSDLRKRIDNESATSNRSSPSSARRRMFRNPTL